MSKLEKITPNQQATKPVVNHSEQSDEAEPIKTYTHKALALYRDPTDTKYVLVEVAFNVDDSNVKTLARDVREDVIDKFKMHAADYFMGDR